MDPLQIIKEWGGWLFGGVATWISLRKNSDEYIDERIDGKVEPLTALIGTVNSTLVRIEGKQDRQGEQLLDVSERLARLEGRDDIRMPPSLHVQR